MSFLGWRRNPMVRRGWNHHVGHWRARSQHLGAALLLPVQIGQLGERTGQHPVVAVGKWLELAQLVQVAFAAPCLETTTQV